MRLFQKMTVSDSLWIYQFRCKTFAENRNAQNGALAHSLADLHCREFSQVRGFEGFFFPNTVETQTSKGRMP